MAYTAIKTNAHKNNVNSINWESSAALYSDETAYFVDNAAAQQFEDKIKQAQGIL